MNVCGKPAVHIPAVDCDDCGAFESRLSALETTLAELVRSVNSRLDSIEQAIEDMKIEEISFTISGAVVCTAVVCQDTCCGEITSTATSAEVVTALRAYDGNNIRLKIGNMEITPDAYTINSNTSYRIYFDVIDGNSNKVGRYTIIGNGNSLTYQYKPV